MNLSKFYIDNPTVIETKIGNDAAETAAIVDGSNAQKALNVFSAGGSVATTPAGVPAYTSIANLYDDVLVPYNTETTVLSYTVPVGDTFYITGFRGWGDTSGEFFVKVDGSIVGGSRSTAAMPSCGDNYANAPIQVMTGHVITITTIMYVPTTHTMRANLFGGIIS